ncbi:MAG: DNA-formamidopyrimidine glycosylase [Patescibacteria group bacterium]|nr:DNA-formamidopyrimidine glycosylase [Patescibacteria group bacterium]
MPELPEVETIRIDLHGRIIGQQIQKVYIISKKSFIGKKFDIVGKKIIGSSRKGKLLIFYLDRDYDLIVHLKMTGQLLFYKRLEKGYLRQQKHTRVVIYLSKGVLIFNDSRRFGWIKAVKKEKLNNELNKLGTDCLELKFDELGKYCSSSKQKIKLLLMDQKKIAGIGNIYASEILFLAGIHPLRESRSLQKEEISRLYLAIKKIIQKALRYKGTSSRNYLRPDGNRGEYQNIFLVYGREGEKCLKCKEKIVRIKINNRSTFYCSHCQK